MERRNQPPDSDAAEASTLGDALSAARHRGFVGRDRELSRCLEAFRAERGPRLHFVYGPGGIGKTALLRELEIRCREAGLDAVRLDARAVPAEGASGAGLPEAGLSDRHDVVLIDNFVPGEEAEARLLDRLLPGLSADAHVVVARRQPPSAKWRADAGWKDLMALVPLRGFERWETEAFLSSRRVDPERHDRLHRITGGHPLALALAAASGSDSGADPGTASGPHQEAGTVPLDKTVPLDETLPFEVIEGLLERLRQEVPSRRHFAALEASSVVRTTQEPLLAALMPDDDVSELFDWLAGLSFVERTPDGLRPHDVVRAALRDHLAWRDPTRLVRVYDRAQSWYLEQLVSLRGQPHGRGATGAMIGLAFLHHANQIGRQYMELGHDEQLRVLPARFDEAAAARQMVLRHQGQEAAAHFDTWHRRQPEQLFVCRGAGSEPLGMIQYVLLSKDNADAASDDPCTDAVFRWVAENGPLRASERLLLTRYWIDAEQHQRVSAVASVLWIHTTIQYRVVPRLAWGLAVFAQPEAWSKPFRYMDFHLAEGADFVVGGHRFGVFAHDWRRLPVQEWNRLLSERRMDPHAQRPKRAQQVLVLARSAFADAVRDALRAQARPAELAGNPLLAGTLVLDRLAKDEAGRQPEADVTERSRVLRRLVAEAAEALRGDVRGDKLHRALTATYLEPAGTQEEVAEHLDLPFTTYRRHLTEAVREVTEWLWALEIGDEVVRA